MFEDREDTARLIMMDMRDEGAKSLIQFHRSMAEHFPGITINTTSHLWQKYMGIDRLLPTHDLDTGERLAR